VTAAPAKPQPWRLPIGQKSDRRAALKVADERAVAVIAPPGPIVDADNRRRRKDSRSTPSHRAQQRVVAYLNVEPTGKGGGRPASQRKSETVNDVVEPARAPGSRFNSLKPFGEDPPGAGRRVAEEAASPQNQRYPNPGGRKIHQSPPILTVHAPTNASARRALAIYPYASDRDDEAGVVFRRALNHEPARNKLRNINSIHSSDPQPNQSQTGASIPSIMSQSQNCTPKHSLVQRLRLNADTA
jgi:hypothetical protein